jgi:ATP-binding cassette, subfamily B, bacterial HlyB/CyaB
MPKLPDTLGISVLNEIDQALENLGIDLKTSITLGVTASGPYVPPSTILDSLAQLPAVSVSVISVDDRLLADSSSQTQIIVMTRGGSRCFLLYRNTADSVRLQRHRKVGDVAQSEDGSWGDLTKRLHLCKAALVIQRRDSDADIAPESTSIATAGDNIVLRHLFANKRLALGTLFTAVLIAALNLVPAFGLRAFFDNVLPNTATDSLIALTILLLFAALATAAFRLLQGYQESVLSARYQNALGKDVLSRLLATDQEALDQRGVVELTKIVDHVREAGTFLTQHVISAFASIASLLLIMPVLMIFNMKLALIIFGIGVMMTLTVVASLPLLRQQVRSTHLFDSLLRSRLLECIHGIRDIRTLGNTAYFLNRCSSALEYNQYGTFKGRRITNATDASLTFHGRLVMICVMFFGAHAVFADKMTVGELIAFNLLANNVINPFLMLAMTAKAWESFCVARSELTAMKPPRETPPPAMEQTIRLHGNIELENVWFAYPNADGLPNSDPRWILRGLTLTIRRGESIGIIGPSGCGKSTLLNLLTGLYRPTRGRILLNGLDLSQIDQRTLSTRIALVPQAPYLFNATVLENVNLGRPDFSVPEIKHALDVAECSAFVDALPLKEYSMIAEGGAQMSVGQRQRIAIARAMLGDADIMLFDEPTSALDQSTGDQVARAIAKALAGRTGIIVSHRPEVLAPCDRIIVMCDGAIASELARGETQQAIPN